MNAFSRSNVAHVYVRLDDFLKCFFLCKAKNKLDTGLALLKKQLGTSLARRGSV